jgi:hypothetical protein
MAGLGIAACSTQSSTGNVSGGIRVLIGADDGQPSNYLSDHQAGTVIVDRQGRVVITRKVGADHAFDFSLPVGTYTVTASVPENPCVGEVASVKAAHTATVEVSCSNGVG